MFKNKPSAPEQTLLSKAFIAEELPECAEVICKPRGMRTSKMPRLRSLTSLKNKLPLTGSSGDESGVESIYFSSGYVAFVRAEST